MTESELAYQIRLLGEEKCQKYFPHCIAAMAYKEQIKERLKQMKQ